jgi:surface carbohydrate biosynthesis protein (TIGR04326 family)
MTLPAAISFGGSTPIYNAVRMLALENLAGELSTIKIILASADEALAGSVRAWCRNARLGFEWRRLKAVQERVSLGRRIYRALPYAIQALVFLLHYLTQRWPLRQVERPADGVSSSTVTFVDYLIHLNPDDAAAGRYGSNFWTELIPALRSSRVQANWLHHFIGHAAVPSARHARDLITRFNGNSVDTVESHATPDGALGWPVIVGVWRDYRRIAQVGLRLRELREHFRPQNSQVDLWPLFEEEWQRSVSGPIAVANCLHLNLLEHVVQHLPHQELGVYLLENQPWEMAFVHAWKSAGHGRLIGAPHSTVLFWDLRYYFDPRSYRRSGNNDLPMPDQVALNGPAVIAAFRGGAFPEDRIVPVEALRYLFLAGPRQGSKQAKPRSSRPLEVLVLGDFFPAITRQQMRWLSDAAAALPGNIRYIVRPHPSCPIHVNDYPSLPLQLSALPLPELLSECEVVYTSNLTSAAVDAYCAGVPVVSVLDGGAFNMSPLRGRPGVIYVTGPGELVHALRHVRERNEAVDEPYFCLDNRLPRWRRLLGLRERRPFAGDVLTMQPS